MAIFLETYSWRSVAVRRDRVRRHIIEIHPWSPNYFYRIHEIFNGDAIYSKCYISQDAHVPLEVFRTYRKLMLKYLMLHKES